MTDYVMITPATATRDSLYCTCFGHLVRYDINRIINICVMSTKVAKASTVVTVACRWRWQYHPKLCQWKYAFSSSFLGLLCCIYSSINYCSNVGKNARDSGLNFTYLGSLRVRRANSTVLESY
jgi:hypothetical protein